jgi:hypothetical protein
LPTITIISGIKSKEIPMTGFRVYWLTGATEVIYGYSITDAFMRAGYSSSAIHAVDWYEKVTSNGFSAQL